MPVLHLENVPNEVYKGLQHLAESNKRTVADEAVDLLREGLGQITGQRSQSELLAELRRRSFAPPIGTADAVELLREDRER